MLAPSPAFYHLQYGEWVGGAGNEVTTAISNNKSFPGTPLSKNKQEVSVTVTCTPGPGDSFAMAN